MFNLKKAKKSIGEFSTDDNHEWTLLTKPQFQDVTEFIHLHRLWLIEEKPEILADEANGVEGQREVKRIPICEAYIGFLKDDKFVVQKMKLVVKERDNAPAQIKFLNHLQVYYDLGYTKDYDNYKGDEPITPSYYSHELNHQTDQAIKSSMRNLVNSQIMSSQISQRPLTTVALKQSSSGSSMAKTDNKFLNFLKLKKKE